MLACMTEVQVLAAAIKRDFPKPTIRESPIDHAAPPVRVIDCVLSLRRPYLKVVEPRVKAFMARFPEVSTCGQLRDLMTREGPSVFLRQRLNMQFPARAEILLNVTKRLVELTDAVEGGSELERIERWASRARPHDYVAFGVKGFGIAGFQYLRLLFGANTTKPDVHIVRYVSKTIGHQVSDLTALHLLEQAAQMSGIPVRAVDSAVWQAGAIHR